MPRRKASLIVADPPHRAMIDARMQGYREQGWLIGEDYRLPYWAHNDHMLVTLRMSMERGQFEPLAAISYQRRGLESRINPVYIEDRDDLDILVQIFFAYVLKAEGYMKPPSPSETGAPPSTAGTGAHGLGRGAVPTVDQTAAEKRRNEQLLEWWTEMRV